MVDPKYLVLWTLATVLPGCGLQQSTFHCERAVAHLQSCCDDLDVPDVCADGLFNDAEPPLDSDTVDCILATPCGDARQVCDALNLHQEALEESSWLGGDDPDSGDTGLGVCP